MQTTNESTLATNQITAPTTTTRTDLGTIPTDSQTISQTFVTRGRASERARFVEEDSTDTFLLERCSPLNDF
jgi:hypothetical protein